MAFTRQNADGIAYVLNEVAKRKASQSVDGEVVLHLHQSSMKLRSVKLRNSGFASMLDHTSSILNEVAKRKASQFCSHRMLSSMDTDPQ